MEQLLPGCMLDRVMRIRGKNQLRHVMSASDHRSRLRQAIFNCLSKSYLREVQRKNVNIELQYTNSAFFPIEFRATLDHDQSEIRLAQAPSDNQQRKDNQGLRFDS